MNTFTVLFIDLLKKLLSSHEICDLKSANYVKKKCTFFNAANFLLHSQSLCSLAPSQWDFWHTSVWLLLGKKMNSMLPLPVTQQDPDTSTQCVLFLEFKGKGHVKWPSVDDSIFTSFLHHSPELTECLLTNYGSQPKLS